MGRLFVFLIIFIAPYMISWAILKIVDSPTNVEYYFVVNFIPFSITLFFCFGFGDQICLKLGLYKSFKTSQKDILRNDSEWDEDYVFTASGG